MGGGQALCIYGDWGGGGGAIGRGGNAAAGGGWDVGVEDKKESDTKNHCVVGAGYWGAGQS